MRVTLPQKSRAADVDRRARGGAPAELLKPHRGRIPWRASAGGPGLDVERSPREVLRGRARKEAGLRPTAARAQHRPGR